jgi:hypothetical protein
MSVEAEVTAPVVLSMAVVSVAVVSVAGLKRIWNQQEVAAIAEGKRPVMFRLGRGGYRTNAEAAEAIQKAQMDRRMEREVLAAAGLAPVPGGELVVEAEVAVPVARRPWWWRFW